jgi:hypothetical protein
MAKGPIRVPAPDPIEEMTGPAAEPETVELPANEILDAGVAKFMELANLHWPTRGLREGFLLTSFDIRDSHKLRMTLGLTYMAMKEQDPEWARALIADGPDSY